MGVIQNGSFISSYYGDQIDALLAAMAQANPLPSGTDWVAFIDDCREAQEAAESAATSAGNSATSAASSASTASTKATQASSSASSAASGATLSQSWAIGGTGTRTGEDTNNAKFWSEQAQHAAGGGVTSWNNRSGVVLPQSGDYTPDMVGATPVVGKGKQLLDNGYFIGGGSQKGDGQLPVNERGSSSYSATSSKYTIDRWYSYVDVTLLDNGLKLEKKSTSAGSSFIQYLENPDSFLGKTFTFSILTSNNELYSVTYAYPNAWPTGSGATNYANYQIGTSGIYLRSSYDRAFTPARLDARMVLSNVGSTITIQAMKLELGNTQTLARKVNGVWVLNDTAPDQELELLRCITSKADTTGDGYAGRASANDKSIAQVLTAMVAKNGPDSGGFNAGRYVMVDGQLYRFLSRVANNTALTTGTNGNVEATSIGADILNYVLGGNLASTKAITNFNDATDTGFYGIATNNATNAPAGIRGCLFVLALNSDFAYQFFITIGNQAQSHTNPTLYFRMHRGSGSGFSAGWSSWSEISGFLPTVTY